MSILMQAPVPTSGLGSGRSTPSHVRVSSRGEVSVPRLPLMEQARAMRSTSKAGTPGEGGMNIIHKGMNEKVRMEEETRQRAA